MKTTPKELIPAEESAQASASESATGRSRPYRSTLRQQQAAATRELILRALAEQMASAGEDFSIADAAERAGVSPRTIYRYFPNREAIIEALGDWVDQQIGDLFFPRTPEEVAMLAEEAFPRFEQQATLIQALLSSQLGQSVRSRLRVRRRQSITEALQPLTEGLSSEEAKATCAVIQHLITAETWKHLRDEFGIAGETAGRAVSQAIRTLIADLEQRQAKLVK
ncbi:MAG TPA: helix-turn-helix domain-containing protein [Trichocoleus sp.]